MVGAMKIPVALVAATVAVSVLATAVTSTPLRVEPAPAETEVVYAVAETNRAQRDLRTPANSQTVRVFEFTMPESPSDGRHYLVRLSLALTVDIAGSGDREGDVVVMASVNDKTAARLKFGLSPAHSAAERTLHWSATNLLQGHVSGVSLDGVYRDSYANYLQIDSLRQGTNRLAVVVENRGDVALDQLTLMPDSAILAMSTPPPSLRIDASPAKTGSEQGIALNYTVEAVNWPARGVSVRVRSLSGESVVERIGTVDGSAQGRIVVPVVSAGEQTIEVAATSTNAGTQVMQMRVEARRSAEGGGVPPPLLLAAVLGLPLAAAGIRNMLRTAVGRYRRRLG